MKILFIVHSVSYKGGGAFFHALQIAKGMKKLNHTVSILSTSQKGCLNFKTSYIENGIELLESPDILGGKARNGWDLYNVFRRILLLNNRNYDLTYCLDCRPVVIFPGLFMKFFKKSKLIIEWLDLFGRGGTASERSYFIKMFMKHIEQFFEESFRKFADGSVILGEQLYNRAVKMGLNKKNIIKIFHGCDIDDCKQLNKKIMRKKYKYDEHDKIIGYLGQMRNSTADLLFETFELFHKNNYNYNLLLIGNHKITDLNNRLININKSLFRETGWISKVHLQEYLSIVDICILPFKKSISTNNIWPSKINDYLTSGKPIVATNLAVIERMFIDNNIGILSDDNPKSFIKNINIMFKNKDLIKMGRNSQNLAKNKFHWDNINNKLDKFFYKVIKGER